MILVMQSPETILSYEAKTARMNLATSAGPKSETSIPVLPRQNTRRTETSSVPSRRRRTCPHESENLSGPITLMPMLA